MKPRTRFRTATVATLAALAPAVWGTTYILFTETLPTSHPWTVGGLRTALAGGLLLAFRPGRIARSQLIRVLILAVVNIAFFSACLFTAAARLPGGVAATLTSTQPLVVLGLTALLSRRRASRVDVAVGVGGVMGVALISLAPGARLDAVGVLAALGAAGSMAAGTVLVHRWSDLPAPATLAGWQLALGGAVLLPIAWFFEGPANLGTPSALTGLALLVIPGTALPHWSWTRGIRELGPNVAYFTLLSPLVAAALGIALLGEVPTPPQLLGGALVMAAAAFGIARVSPRVPARSCSTPFAVPDRSTRGKRPHSTTERYA